VDNALTAFAADSAELFAATDSGVFASTTKGDTWNLLGLKDTLVTALAVRGGNVYAGGGRAHWSGVLLSTDNGHSWSEIYSPSKDSMSWFITGLAVNGQSVFASGIIGGFAGSRGGWLSVRIVRDGTHWMLADSGLPGLSTFLAICGSNLFAGETSLFRSTNGGANWNQVTGGLANTNVNALAVSGSNLFAATGSVNGSPGCVFLSTDNGTSWTSVNSGLTGIWVSSLAVSGPNIYAGTIGCGVWRRPLLEMVTSVQPGIREVPRQFLLNQNYPNPFNPSTTIRYDLPRSSMVRLNVYDILGREVAVLVNERKNAGSYEVKFDAVRLASGVYFYRIQAGDFIQAKKLVVIK